MKLEEENELDLDFPKPVTFDEDEEANVSEPKIAAGAKINLDKLESILGDLSDQELADFYSKVTTDDVKYKNGIFYVYHALDGSLYDYQPRAELINFIIDMLDELYDGRINSIYTFKNNLFITFDSALIIEVAKDLDIEPSKLI